jgi:hypothetical protein
MMNLIYTISSYFGVVVFAIIFMYAVSMTPKCSHAVANHDYRDLRDIPRYSDVSFDGTVTLEQLQIGDLVVFKLGEKKELKFLFGYVAGLPGNKIGLKNRMVQIDGRDYLAEVAQARGVTADKMRQGWRPPEHTVPDRAAVEIPAHHAFIVSDRHIYDSLVLGPIPRANILGRVTSIKVQE